MLRREVSVLPGKLLSQRELEASRRRLVNSGYFSDPSDPRHPLPYYQLVPVDGSPDEVDVVFQVEEGRNVDLRFTAGIDSNNGLVGLVSLSMSNFEAADLPSGFFSTFSEVYSKEAFHGNGETFAVNLSPGSEVDQYSIDYSHPDAFGTHFNRTGFGIGLSERTRQYRSHDEQRGRARVFLSHMFGQGDVSLRVGAEFQNLQLDGYDDGDLPVTLTHTPADSDFVGMDVELRISSLDNFRMPRKGQFLKWDTTLYGGPFGGDNDLLKTELTYDYYYLFGPESISARPGLHVGLRGGVAAPYGDTEIAHYGERFFGGGSAWMRGFRYRGMGPYNGDYPLGGETMVGGTFEYRVPIYTTPIAGTAERAEVFRLILFSDWGILDPEAWQIDPDQLRVTAGFGIGMLQPIPLSFNFGWPVRDYNSDESQVFSFTLSLR
ncbi:MAG: BamA/TamA family outer membrane protein [Planctomycetota bacterium]